MSACPAMAGSAARSSADRAGRSSVVPGKLTPFSSRSLSPLARAPTTSTIRSFPSTPTTRPRILPSSIQTCACKGSFATTSAKPTVTTVMAPRLVSSGAAAKRKQSPTWRRAGFLGRKRLDSTLGAGQIHLDSAVAAELVRRQPDVADHGGPRRRVVVRAVDAGAVQPGGDESLDQGGVGRRFARQGDHDRRRVFLPAEQRAALGAEKALALRPDVGGRKGSVAGAADARQRRSHRVEIGHDVALATPERGKPERRQRRLQLGKVAASKREIAREVLGRRPVSGKRDRGAPALQQVLGLAPDAGADFDDGVERRAGRHFDRLSGMRRRRRRRGRIRFRRRIIGHRASP